MVHPNYSDCPRCAQPKPGETSHCLSCGWPYRRESDEDTAGCQSTATSSWPNDPRHPYHTIPDDLQRIPRALKQ